MRDTNQRGWRLFPFRRLSVAALALALAVPAVLPQAASALNQTFWAQGTGDFGTELNEPGGGEIALTQVSSGVVRWRDQSAGGDLTYTVSTGQQPVQKGHWLVLSIGPTPTDITLDGSHFRVRGKATFTASVHGHGRVGTLGGVGNYGVGDDGSGNPIIRWPYNVSNVKVGTITTETVTVIDSGDMFGDFNTLGKRLSFHGRNFGGARFVDLSDAQDMVVTCTGVGAKRKTTDDHGHQVVRCLGRRGRAAVGGSNVHFRVGAGRLVAQFPADVAGHLRGRIGAMHRAFFSPF